MRVMRRIAWIATLLIPLHALPSGAFDERRPVSSPSPSPAPAQTIEAEGPPYHLAALGFLAPGTPQFLFGERPKAGVYLGGTALLGVGSYLALRQIFYPESFQPNAFFPAESHALIAVNAIGISWLIGGVASTLDALLTLQASDPGADPAEAAPATAVPMPVPTAVPTPVPTPKPLPAPVFEPTPIPAPQATPIPVPRWTPAPIVAPTPTPTPSPSPSADPEAAVYRAYDYAAKGEFLEAVLQIHEIRDPDWLPKANALMSEWGAIAVDQGLTRARAYLARGEHDAAKQVLDQLAVLPRSAAQTRALELLRQSLR